MGLTFPIVNRKPYDYRFVSWNVSQVIAISHITALAREQRF
jgi:hypothetical protein